MEGAAAAYRKALVIDPDLVPAIVNLANIHYARDEMIEAQALYERAIGLDPDCFEAYFNLGNIHHDLGRYEDALRCYRGAVRLNAGYPDAHFYLAVTLEKTGHSPEAKPHWRAYQDLARRTANGRIWRGSSASRRVGGSVSSGFGGRSRLEQARPPNSEPRTRVVSTRNRFDRASWVCGGACRTRTQGTRTRA